ncbi:hypothetical protein Q5P01_010664 [Channa striata]|uniref:Uncharacterized protein n=1 Tax=Channa striata TaxID=64152 RepID=A0AA88MS31_CHASR|nr:hypothetical protein Q5P01_010664 [Channa striata]
MRQKEAQREGLRRKRRGEQGGEGEDSMLLVQQGELTKRDRERESTELHETLGPNRSELQLGGRLRCSCEVSKRRSDKQKELKRKRGGCLGSSHRL